MLNNTTISKFHEKQAKAKHFMEQLNNFVAHGVELGAIKDHSIKNKLDTVIQLVENGSKLKIAFLGGFSEGKTSIIAAWLEHFDKEMRISQEESSNKVTVYNVDSEIELIDTPGLFGFKEEYNADSRELERYRDMTKKYISEAHLVLYVMDPANPIKESHKAILTWLFRTLNLLPRTIFVLNKFDEITDIEDDWLYYDAYKIKKGNVIERLKELVNLTKEEENAISIVAVSANPYKKGFDYWLQHIEDFNKISRIASLREATTLAIEKNGGYFPMIYEMQKSVAKDILTKQLPEIKRQNEEASKALAGIETNCQNIRQQLNILKTDIANTSASLRQFVNGYIGDLIKQTDGCGLETVKRFVDSEIGESGCVVNSTIESEFKRQTCSITAEIEKVTMQFEADITRHDTISQKMFSAGVRYLEGGINNNAVLRSRDIVVGASKIVGADLSQILKFKPWGAVKLANHCNTFLAGLGLLLEALDSYKRQKAEEELQRAKKELIDELAKIRNALIDSINSEKFIEEWFPDYVQLVKDVEHEIKNLHSYENRKTALENWYVEGETIDAEFRTLA